MTDATRHFLSSWAIPVVALLITVCAAFYQLSESPAVWYDEGFFAQAAINLNTHGLQVMQLAPGSFLSSWSISAGYPLIYPISVAFDWFGVSVFSARSVTALYTVLFVAVVYLFIRREAGVVFAGIAALLLASLPLLYGNGKAVLGEVPALFYFILMLLALQRFERSGYTNRFAAFMVGITAGLSFAAKFTFMLVPVAFFMALLLRSQSTLRLIDLKNWALGVIGFLIPVSVWFLLQFQSGDSVATVLQFFANPYDYGTAALGAGVIANILRFVTEVTPLYMLGIFILWAASLFIRHRRGERATFAELVAFSFTVFVLLAYLRTPGWYRYFFPAMVVGLLYTLQSVSIVWQWLTEKFRFLTHFFWLPYAGFILLILLQFYQLGWNSYVANYYGSTRTETLSSYFSTVDPEADVFLYNVPEIAVFLPNQNFYQYLNPHVNQGFGADALPLLAEGAPDIVVVNAETYDIEKEVFVKYEIKDHVSRYVVLTPL